MKILTSFFRSSRARIFSLLLLAGILVAIAVPVFASSPGWKQQSQQRSGQERIAKQSGRYLECSEVKGEVFYYDNRFEKAQERRAKVGDRISRPG